VPYAHKWPICRHYVLGMRLIAAVVLITCCWSCIVPIPQPARMKNPVQKLSPYQQVDLEGMIRRYIAKTHHESSIEGIYTVSCVITKKGKTFLSQVERERIVMRKDNYAKVALLKDWPGSNTEYVEISLHEKNAARYPIVAELNGLSEGGGFIYKHFEPKGKVLSFTFLYDQSKPDILEGVYTVNERNSEVTYKLTYVKVYPKNNNLQSGD
jgi:hypothetical protein